MVSRRLVPALTSFVVVSSLLTFLSCEINAKPERMVKSEKPKRPYKCCMAGYEGCPTTGTDGCECCGFSVTALLTDFDTKTMEGKLQIRGIDTPLDFRVDSASYPNANKELPDMRQKSGQFILKSRMYEYEIKNPNKEPMIKYWHGKAFYCEGMGNDGGKMEDRTEEFLQGLELSDTINGVRSILERSVPAYPIERDKDKGKLMK